MPHPPPAPLGVLASAVLSTTLAACVPTGDPAPGEAHPPAAYGKADGDSAQVSDEFRSGPRVDAPGAVRFIAMGDTGEGNDAQYEVADAIRRVCDADGCDFAILLGDNIYDAGVESIHDPQWLEKFEAPYADLDFPFFAVLGNHDYGGQLFFIPIPGTGNEFRRGPIEVAYGTVSDKWRMPDTFYTFRWGNVGFVMLDTNSLLWANTDNGDQYDWYPRAIAELADADWVFAAGHHPYRSNGRHGNAGNYDALKLGDADLPNLILFANGGFVKDFFDRYVCGTVDAYFAGHDHNRQWVDEPRALCGTELVVSGAGAKTTDLVGRGNDTHFEDDREVGFLHVVVEGRTMTGRFIDRDGTARFSRTVRK